MDESPEMTIHRMRSENPPEKWTIVGEAVQMHPEKARSKYRRFLLQQDGVSIEQEELDGEEFDTLNPYVQFLDKKYSEDIDWRELIDLASTSSAINQRMSGSQRTANIRIHTKDPIAILYTGDWHLGDSMVDYSRWLEDMRILLDTPNLYMIDMGDDYQNMRQFKNLASVLGQVLQPRQQVALMNSLITELTEKEKLLGFKM